ncbi:MAG: DUF1080 domain-containing protein [Bacteroidales bacterium]|nr:DUF1080 domain-containing protein [Bacteroidales bacterium]
MKRTLTVIVLAAAFLQGTFTFAQDSRNRTVETIVADVLAQMPAQDKAAFDRNMADLAMSAPKSILVLGSKMHAPVAGIGNNLVEYAIAGVTAYVSDPANSQYRAAVLEGLNIASMQVGDFYNAQFMKEQARLLGPVPVPEEQPVPGKDDVKAAKKMLASGNSGQMCAAAQTIVAASTPAKALKFLGKAFSNEDRPFRNAVLGFVAEKAGVDEVAKVLTKIFPKLSDEARTDAVNWFGDKGLTSAMDMVLSSVGKGGELGSAAVSAAGKIGGSMALNSLVGLLAKGNQDAFTALRSYKGDIAPTVMAALEADKGNLNLISLAAARGIKAAAPYAAALFNSPDRAARLCGISALQAIGEVSDAPSFISLIDKGSELKEAGNGLINLLRRLSPDDKYSTVKALQKDMANPDRLYPVIAATNAAAAVEDLKNAWDGGDASALAALATMNCDNVAPLLLKALKGGEKGNESLLERFIALSSRYSKDSDAAYKALAQALELAQTPKLKNTALKALGKLPTLKSFLLAGKYLDVPECAYTAAEVVKGIASSTKEELDYNTLLNTLSKARDVFNSTGDADDGYAVDEINKMLSLREPSPISVLTPEEEAEGFVMLFDGTSLDNWQGDKEGYVPMNGTIYVSANYGSEGNLYTNKQYKDFIFRFEFCFLREGVNNGVGIRTPMGVDAAYDGMCEVQILDHDAPMYDGLREYQVHGSVYGVIPARRIRHKPLGEWSTEEIIVRGTHVKVTVNGEVIVDGDVRKACKGHNVAPDGSSRNNYTVDHRNHPGLFNKEGYISFCGHGEGLKIRNVRIKEL